MEETQPSQPLMDGSLMDSSSNDDDDDDGKLLG
jgi:hypothetical protein